jgi:hypothetical protein
MTNFVEDNTFNCINSAAQLHNSDFEHPAKENKQFLLACKG